MLVSPDLEVLIARFLPKRKKQLTVALENALAIAKRPTLPTVVRANAQPAPTPLPTDIQLYTKRLDELRDFHIFQWATYYRDVIGYIFKNLLSTLKNTDTWHSELESVSNDFARHSNEIFSQGYRYLANNKISDEVALIKSSNGLQKFLDVIINIYIANRDLVNSAKDARLTWATTSSLLVGVLRGYGKTAFGALSGWHMLRLNSRSWIPALGFLNGSDATSLLQDFPSSAAPADIFSAVAPTLVAFDQLSNKYHGTRFLLPRLSRVAAGQPSRLEITVTAFENVPVRDIIVTCFFDGPLSDSRFLTDAINQRATAVVAKLSTAAREWAAQQGKNPKVIDVSDVTARVDDAQNFAQIIRATIEAEIRADSGLQSTQSFNRNYAREFPLEDPDFRRYFLVERHSVKRLLDQFQTETGVHLWCSVRRSGKTTAVSNMADVTGHAVVVVQTMDHQSHQLELNVLERRVREALQKRIPIAQDFFSNVVRECVISSVSIEMAQMKVILVIDEYETLFGLIEAFTKDDIGLRYLVAQPLLSQMVSFATANLLILMGQRPDAHYVLASQNQLSPLVRQHNFPLFEHHSGGNDTEFSQFLRRVLTEKMQFAPSFVDAVYQETSGHPYLTVNLMVDLCDWLIENHVEEGRSQLDAARFAAFVRDRLSQAMIQRSPHYTFFQTMLGDYLSERSRQQEPWLYAMASVLHDIGKKHPKSFSCTIVNYQHLAQTASRSARLTPDQLLSSGTMSNFLRVHDGHVAPAIRLMGRLAASVVPELN